MKLKATVSEDTPSNIVRAFNSLRQEVMQQVIGPHLHRPEFGPAEFYLQLCDEGEGSGGFFCEVRLSGISRTEDRTEEDFRTARNKLAEIYRQIISRELSEGWRMQLMVTLMVDSPPSLYETEAEWVDGKAYPG